MSYQDPSFLYPASVVRDASGRLHGIRFGDETSGHVIIYEYQSRHIDPNIAPEIRPGSLEEFASLESRMRSKITSEDIEYPFEKPLFHATALKDSSDKILAAKFGDKKVGERIVIYGDSFELQIGKLCDHITSSELDDPQREATLTAINKLLEPQLPSPLDPEDFSTFTHAKLLTAAIMEKYPDPVERLEVFLTALKSEMQDAYPLKPATFYKADILKNPHLGYQREWADLAKIPGVRETKEDLEYPISGKKLNWFQTVEDSPIPQFQPPVLKLEANGECRLIFREDIQEAKQGAFWELGNGKGEFAKLVVDRNGSQNTVVCMTLETPEGGNLLVYDTQDASITEMQEQPDKKIRAKAPNTVFRKLGS